VSVSASASAVKAEKAEKTVPPPEVDDEEMDDEAALAQRVQELLRKHKRPEFPIQATEGHFGYLTVVDPSIADDFAASQGEIMNRKTRRGSGGAPGCIGDAGDPRVQEVYKTRFCMCRKTLEFGEKYIVCNVGRRDVCNGWVHLWCAKLGRADGEKLRNMTDYVCEECLESSSEEESEDEEARKRAKRVSGTGKKEKDKGKEKDKQKEKREKEKPKEVVEKRRRR
jgi:hypothetical protein